MAVFRKHLIYYLLACFALLCVFSILAFNGTGDDGDSITHYLFARYAPAHPELYFNHWAKPLFVLLCSPLAQMGFVGMKIFNALVAMCVLFFSYKTAQQLNLQNPALVIILLVFSPLFYILTFSGLTEPLFALFVVAGVYFVSRKNYLPAALLISFLPYIRSEGLIVLGLFGLYFVYKQLWRLIPWLLSGSVLYGIAGYFVHGSVLWVLTKIPYAKLSSVYGSGPLFHFVEQLINVTGVPIYLLFWIGCIRLLVSLFKQKFHPENHILLLLGFASFFIAHSLFWYLGIFNSMGLKRVFIGILPLMALIALQGFNFLVEELSKPHPRLQKTLRVGLVCYVLFFPFTTNPSALHWKKDLLLSAEQNAAMETAHFVRLQQKTGAPLVFNYRYLCLPLQIDYFDPLQSRQLSLEVIQEVTAGTLIIWDNMYGEFESGIRKGTLDSLPTIQQLRTFNVKDAGRQNTFVVYKKI